MWHRISEQCQAAFSTQQHSSTAASGLILEDTNPHLCFFTTEGLRVLPCAKPSRPLDHLIANSWNECSQHQHPQKPPSPALIMSQHGGLHLPLWEHEPQMLCWCSQIYCCPQRLH